MRRIVFLSFTCILLILELTSCVSTYHHKAASAYRAYDQGRFDDAARLIEKVHPARRDELLYLMDKGMMLHAAGKYAKSNQALTQAEELADAIAAKSLTREAAAALWSEEATEYSGEKHERLLLPTLRMLNFIMLDDWNAALVEVRRLITQTEKIYGNPRELQNAFSLYLSAIIWEALGQINDALISYSRLEKQGKQVPYYGHDIAKVRSRLGLQTALPPKGSTAWNASKDYRAYPGELVVIVEAGRSPIFQSAWLSTGLIHVEIPTLRFFPQRVRSAEVVIDGLPAGSTAPFYNIFQDILTALKERQKRNLVRKLVKVPVQSALFIAGGELMQEDETEAKIAGLGMSLLALSMTVAEKADERSWQTLPAQFQIGRFFLPPGRHEVKILPQGEGQPTAQSVEIVAGKPKVLLLHFPQSSQTGQSFAEVEKAYARMDPEEARLRERVQQAPQDGNAKIELAYALLKQGRYDLDGLILDGIEQGGDLARATQALAIVYMVEGEYAKARAALDRAKRRGVRERKFLALSLSMAELQGGFSGVSVTEQDFSFQETSALNEGFRIFLKGLFLEHEMRFGEAAMSFMQAYRKGLIGEPVARKAVSAYKRSDDAFKRSPEGIELLQAFADTYLTENPQ